MLVILLKFNRIAQACSKKFNHIFASYKEDKLANGISCNNRQKNKFHDALDQWYHQAGQVFKYVSATTNDSVDFPSNYFLEVENAPISIPPSISKTKNNFQEISTEFFEKIVETNIGLIIFFERTNELLERVDHKFDRLIDRL